MGIPVSSVQAKGAFAASCFQLMGSSNFIDVIHPRSAVEAYTFFLSGEMFGNDNVLYNSFSYHNMISN
jgi:hypothetical protein